MTVEFFEPSSLHLIIKRFFLTNIWFDSPYPRFYLDEVSRQPFYKVQSRLQVLAYQTRKLVAIKAICHVMLLIM